MSSKKQMADTARMVDFFNTLTDRDVEMIEWIDEAIEEKKRPNLERFEETFASDHRPRNEIVSDISRKYLDWWHKSKTGTEGLIRTTLSWYDPHHEGYHEVGSDKEFH